MERVKFSLNFRIDSQNTLLDKKYEKLSEILRTIAQRSDLEENKGIFIGNHLITISDIQQPEKDNIESELLLSNPRNEISYEKVVISKIAITTNSNKDVLNWEIIACIESISYICLETIGENEYLCKNLLSGETVSIFKDNFKTKDVLDAQLWEDLQP